MGETDAGPRPDVELLAYISARQDALARAAFLVCGDAGLAERLLRASLVALARDWDRVREESPDLVVRRSLYRDAVAACRVATGHRRGDGPGDAGADEGGSEPPAAADAWSGDPDELRHHVRRALGSLSPEQRAVVVLRTFEDRTEQESAAVLGLPPATVRAHSALALDRLSAVAEHVAPGLVGSGTPATDVRGLLELVSDEVPEPDLANEVRAEADARRRLVHRRVAMGAAAAGAVGAVAVAVAVAGRQQHPAPTRPSPSARPVPQRLATAVVGGLRVSLAPEPDAEQVLARYPDALLLGLPSVMGFGDAFGMPVLGPSGTLTEQDASVRAVLIASTGDEAVIPVLYTPRGAASRYLALTGVRLERLGPTGEVGPLVGAHTVEQDRRRLVFPQPQGVVLVDGRDGTRRTVPVGAPVEEAGWARDGRTVIATGGGRTWSLDTDTGDVTEVEEPAHPGWVELRNDSDGTTLLRSHSGEGRPVGGLRLEGSPVEVTGGSVSTTDGWAAAPARLGRAEQRALSRSQGLVAVQADPPPAPHVLAASTASGVLPGAYLPLAWAPQGVLILESRSFDLQAERPVRRILAWDVLGETLTRVAEVARTEDRPGAFTGDYAL